jgi:ADP-ribose pyrophosphatase YjhB (NUDIX family)
LPPSSALDLVRRHEVQAVAAELASAWGEEPEELAAAFSAEAGHATPKVDIRGAVVRDGRILLVRNWDDGLWSMPGGWAEVGETPAQSVRKEVREEAGLEVTPVALLGVYERDTRHRPRFPFYGYRLLFLCEGEGEPRPDGIETHAAEFRAPDDLPPLSGRTSAGEIERAFAYLRDPASPPHFV